VKALYRLLAVAACVLPLQALAAAPAPADWEKVVSAAKAEGRLVFYNGVASTVVMKTITDEFEKRYGIRVDTLSGRPTEVRERIRVEQAAGRAVGDVAMDGFTVDQPAYASLFEPHEGVPAGARLVAPYVDNGRLLPVTATRLGILVNTRLVRPADEPASWQDLLDPKWKGKILSDDPRAAGGGAIAYDVFYEKLGRQFVEKLAAQKPTFGRDVIVNQRRVAQGEFPLYMPFNFQSVPNVVGLPVKLVVPKEGYPYIGILVARIKGAPHPNAARLFMNHLLESQQQRRFLENGFATVTNEAPDALTPALRAAANHKPMGTPKPQGMDERRKVFTEILEKEGIK
jgi:iron(III) transport system substrate-binding protein